MELALFGSLSGMVGTRPEIPGRSVGGHILEVANFAMVAPTTDCYSAWSGGFATPSPWPPPEIAVSFQSWAISRDFFSGGLQPCWESFAQDREGWRWLVETLVKAMDAQGGYPGAVQA